VTSWGWITGDLLYLEWNVADAVNQNLLGRLALVDRNAGVSRGSAGDPVGLPAAIDAHPDNPGRTVYRYDNADDLVSRYRYASGHRMSIEYFRGNCGRDILRSPWVWGVIQVSDQRPPPSGGGGGADETRWPVRAVSAQQ
jgi:hypothetical protein